NKTVACATAASFVSTLAGYPLDSLKSRLQASRVPMSVPSLAVAVFREEGVAGFFRGLWIPLMTISAVRAASFTIYGNTKEFLKTRDLLTKFNFLNVAGAGGLGGAMAGALISFGSAPFELMKIRRQLEFSIALEKGQKCLKPPGTLQALKDIIQVAGFRGLYTGFRLHFLRDTSGTALYFLEYDGFRYLMGRRLSGEQGDPPTWLPIHPTLIPFLCGSLAGVTSWALIYPLDVVKTKVQQRALAGKPRRTVLETLHRLIRGPDPDHPKPVVSGITRLYRGLGVSALRSVTTHGLLWTVFDYVSGYIDRLPRKLED
ncbi:mitochondrial carrier, partial [Sistotremastrum suecicum HHB10207 ss-3]